MLLRLHAYNHAVGRHDGHSLVTWHTHLFTWLLLSMLHGTIGCICIPLSGTCEYLTASECKKGLVCYNGGICAQHPDKPDEDTCACASEFVGWRLTWRRLVYLKSFGLHNRIPCNPSRPRFTSREFRQRAGCTSDVCVDTVGNACCQRCCTQHTVLGCV